MQLYYAHCMSIYNTPQEKRDIDLLKSLGFVVDNPNSPHHEPGWSAVGMRYAEIPISECDIVAFRALPDGSISSGVAKELEIAQRLNKPIFELPSSIGRRAMTYEQTREYLREVGFR
jgi:hypothetical protein